MVALSIRGFGVRDPGGAPPLTSPYSHHSISSRSFGAAWVSHGCGPSRGASGVADRLGRTGFGPGEALGAADSGGALASCRRCGLPGLRAAAANTSRAVASAILICSVMSTLV